MGLPRGLDRGVREAAYLGALHFAHQDLPPCGLAASAALRRRSWLFFRATHVIGSPMFFLAGCMHWPSLVWWLVPSLALHFAKVADRLCQGLLSVPAVSALEQPSSGRGAAVRRKAVRIKLPQLLGHVQL